MHARHEYGSLVWIDLESPNRMEVREIAEEFDIAEHVGEEMLLPSSKARADFFGSYAFIVMHFPALKHTHTSPEQEVDFVVGRDFLVTTHYDTVDSLHKFAKVFEVNSILNTESLGDHAGFLFFYTIKKLYKAIEYEVDFLRKELAVIEEHIFLGREVEMVSAISKTSRALLNLRQTIEPHRDILRSLEENGPLFFGADFLPYLRSLSNEYYRVHNHITRATDSLHELRETNNSLLSTKQNQTMKIFTILAFFTFPLSLIVAVIGMDTADNPILNLPHSFLIILGILAFSASMMFLFFRHKRWI